VEEYFDRYFLFGLPADDIADFTACQALTAISQGEETPEFLEVECRATGPDPETASRIIRKLTRLSAYPGVIDAGDPGRVLRYALSLPARNSWAANALLGSPEHQCITWATELITLISHAGLRLDPALAKSLDDAAFACLCQALRQATLAPGEHSQALLETCDQIAGEASERVRRHLQQGDNASLSLSVDLLVQFINRSAARARLADMVLADLDARQYTLADLASRFVTVGRFSRDRSELIGFDDEALVALMGLSRLWNLAANDGELSTTASPADETDTTWPRRRKAGLAQLTQVLQQRRATPPPPPSGVRGGPSPAQQTGPRHWANQMPSTSPASGENALLCLRAAILLPSTAQGLPSGQGSTAIFEDPRAKALAKILAQVELTAWCRRAAHSIGLDLKPQWAEEGFSNPMYAGFFLRPEKADTKPPLQGHCAITTGSSRTGDADVLALALDLLLYLPFPGQQDPTGTVSLIKGDRLRIQQLTELTEIVTQSAIQAARKASAELLHASPASGHLAVWIDTTKPLDQVVNLDEFPAVSSQSAPTETGVFADLPLEPGQAYDSADFTTSVRGVAVELIHTLLRTSGRRHYTETLHALRDIGYDQADRPAGNAADAG
jgi:hypothetical protein